MDTDTPLPAADPNLNEVAPRSRRDSWPGHLVAPGPCGWLWWKDAVLRSAGFPAARLESFSNPELGRLADEANRAESRLRNAILSAEALLRERIAAVRRLGADAHRDELRALRRTQRALKALRDGKDVDGISWSLDAATVGAVKRAVACRDRAGEEFLQTFQVSLAASGEAVKAFALDPAFRSAVGWQNMEAVYTALDPLAAGEAMPGSKRRQRESLVANYVQRYCAKNDTIGFFGPMAWIRIEDGAIESTFNSGPGLVRGRSIHFEDWAIDSFASRLAADDRYVPWLVAYRQPFLRMDNGMLRLPGGRIFPLSAKASVVLAACNGVDIARDLARIILSDPFSPFTIEDEVYTELRALERERRIRLAFAVPSCGDDPDLALQGQLERIDDLSLRGSALADLHALSSAKSAVHAAAHDPSLLGPALQGLHNCFAEVVGGPDRRRPGEVYGGRALIYEDCHRDVSLTLSTQALRPATEALELVMTSARWFTAAACRRFENAFSAQFDRLCAEHDQTAIPLSDFWIRAQSILFGDEVPIDQLADELRDRWEAILLCDVSGAQNRVQCDVSIVRRRVEAAFPKNVGAWKLSHYQCPDLMFCAKDPASLLNGEYLAVLGEVHVGGNTVATNLFASQHPDRRRLLESLRSDLGTPYVMPKLSPDASGTPTRTQWLDDPDAAIEVLFSGGFIAANPETAVASAELDVARDQGELVVRDVARSWQVPLVDALGDFLFLAVINRFGLLHKRAYTPRVTVGRLVVQRESWSFDADALVFACEEDDCVLFRAARAWRAEQQLPHRMFVKMGWEAKPMFVDFDSILSLRMLAKQIRRGSHLVAESSGRLTFSEVLPDFEELWLCDSNGHRFTSEVRLVAIHAEDVLPSGAE